MRYLEINADLCTGCRTCETVCSFYKTGSVNRGRSRIRIRRADVLSFDTLVCLQCQDPPCLKACPRKAIIQKGGQVRVIAELCDGCGECLKVCDKLFLSPEKDTVLMCDQCGLCIPQCPEGALKIIKRGSCKI